MYKKWLFLFFSVPKFYILGGGLAGGTARPVAAQTVHNAFGIQHRN